MSVEIKFRGLTSGSGIWVYGDLIQLDNDTLIAGKDMSAGQFINGHIELQAISVYPESLGQFTGLKDKNGTDIYDRDILKVNAKHGFNPELLNEFKEKNNLETINGICTHFTGIIVIDLLRGLMFKNPQNGYMEPMFTRHIDIKRNHSGVEVVGNFYQNQEILL